MALVRWHIFFSGDVQFVGFRYTSYYLAKRLYLTGWVDNLSDGRVEMEVQGNPIQLQKLLGQLKSQPQIHIEHMDIEKMEPQPYERGFKVKGYSF